MIITLFVVHKRKERKNTEFKTYSILLFYFDYDTILLYLF